MTVAVAPFETVRVFVTVTVKPPPWAVLVTVTVPAGTVLVWVIVETPPWTVVVTVPVGTVLV